jgi:dTDP-4-amino-4,6-dideoxygalactose transaminase
MKISFNVPYMTGKELWYISQAHATNHLSGDGRFTDKCNDWIEKGIGCCKAMLTHSCTAALEMCALLADIKPGDEIIMPSYTFVSTANAFVLRGAVPVFVDIRSDTMNINEQLIEGAITKRTKAIVAVHYAGVGCEMDNIMAIANKYGLLVIEDAAQGIMAYYKSRALGSIGHLSALSFHETKNIISGEGGALLINDKRFIKRAEIIREKGTNRSMFFRGEIDKYTWADIGSSYLPAEIIAAFLWAQMEEAESLTRRRIEIWNTYHNCFSVLEKEGTIHRPVIPSHCRHNAHMYYLILPNYKFRTRFIESLKKKGITTVFHYVPLHDSPMGLRVGRACGDLPITRDVSQRLVRLPLWIGLEDYLTKTIHEIIRTISSISE